MAFAGIIAGSIEAIVTMPFEVIKTKQQIEMRRKGGKVSLSYSISSMWRTEGIRGFFTGLPIMMLQSGGKVGIRFGSYRMMNELLPNKPIITGSIAGVLEALMWITPCERIKVLLIKHSTEKNLFGKVSQSLYGGGWRALYGGALPTVIRNGGFVGTRLALFQELNPVIGYAAVTGGLVGALTTVLNNPVDVIKSRVQATEPSKRVSTLETVRGIIKRHGLRSLFVTGLSARLWKISLGQAVIFQTVSVLS